VDEGKESSYKGLVGREVRKIGGQGIWKKKGLRKEKVPSLRRSFQTTGIQGEWGTAIRDREDRELP